MNLAELSAEFPREDVHWRAQTLTRNGDKALALAYLDARDVMDRLDAVCGPENWQSEISETAKGRVICRLGIQINDQWIWKSDGAGDTAVEGEKGGISDSIKRAAVLWGIGRYLYRMPNVWVPCETYEKNGKQHWSKWTADPWSCVRMPQKPSASEVETIIGQIERAQSLGDLQAEWKTINANLRHIADDPRVIKAKDARKAALTQERKAA